MSETSSWYQRKLASLRQPASNSGINRSPQTVAYASPPVVSYTTMAPSRNTPPPNIHVTTENLYEAASQWKGGPGAKANPDPCPKCGGNQYFANLSLNRRGPSPAGHCYNCGFNGGMFEQGLSSSWGGN